LREPTSISLRETVGEGKNTTDVIVKVNQKNYLRGRELDIRGGRLDLDSIFALRRETKHP